MAIQIIDLPWFTKHGDFFSIFFFVWLFTSSENQPIPSENLSDRPSVPPSNQPTPARTVPWKPGAQTQSPVS